MPHFDLVTCRRRAGASINLVELQQLLEHFDHVARQRQPGPTWGPDRACSCVVLGYHQVQLVKRTADASWAAMGGAAACRCSIGSRDVCFVSATFTS